MTVATPTAMVYQRMSPRVLTGAMPRGRHVRMRSLLRGSERTAMARPNLSPNMRDIGYRFLELRRGMGIGVRAVAEMSGISAATVSRLERARERWVNRCPLAEAGATEEHVLGFWSVQPFDLRLKSYEGNCDLCFLKGVGKITRIMREHPELVSWWAEAEAEAEAEARNSKPEGARFRADRPGYAELLDLTKRQGILPFVFFDDLESCDIGCTDQEPRSDLRELSTAPDGPATPGVRG